MIEHMESENRHEFDVTLATFEHPRYELIATGDIYDGPDEVAALLRRRRGRRFPTSATSCSTSITPTTR